MVPLTALCHLLHPITPITDESWPGDSTPSCCGKAEPRISFCWGTSLLPGEGRHTGVCIYGEEPASSKVNIHLLGRNLESQNSQGISIVILPRALWAVCGRAMRSPYILAFSVASRSKMPDALPTQCPREAPVSCGKHSHLLACMEPRSF